MGRECSQGDSCCPEVCRPLRTRGRPFLLPSRFIQPEKIAAIICMRFLPLPTREIKRSRSFSKKRGGGFLHQQLDLPFFVFHFCSQGLRTSGAQVFVLVALRQNKQKTFPYWCGLAASRAEKGAGFKLAEGRLGLLRGSGLLRHRRLTVYHSAPTIFKSLFISMLRIS